MFFLTSTEIAHYRSELSSIPDALRALDMIEDCEGDLEDAAIALALQVGQEPDRSDRWLDGLAKRWRVFLCQQFALDGVGLATVVQALVGETSLPAVLATAVVIYILKTGVENFCKPLRELR